MKVSFTFLVNSMTNLHIKKRGFVKHLLWLVFFVCDCIFFNISLKEVSVRENWVTPLKCQNAQICSSLLQGKTAIHPKAVQVLRVKIVSGCNVCDGGIAHHFNIVLKTSLMVIKVGILKLFFGLIQISLAIRGRFLAVTLNFGAQQNDIIHM